MTQLRYSKSDLVLFVPRLGKQKLETVTQPTPNKNEKFHELPKPTGNLPYHLSLNKVIPKAEVKRIDNSGSISFHIVGDTGGTKTQQLNI